MNLFLVNLLLFIYYFMYQYAFYVMYLSIFYIIYHSLIIKFILVSSLALFLKFLFHPIVMLHNRNKWDNKWLEF